MFKFSHVTTVGIRWVFLEKNALIGNKNYNDFGGDLTVQKIVGMVYKGRRRLTNYNLNVMII
jgi:hypothetical protein